MRNQTGINENSNQILTFKTKCPTNRTALPLHGEMSEGQRGSAIYEEQRSMAEHHPGGGVHPHGSTDCSGNYELHETGQLTVDN